MITKELLKELRFDIEEALTEVGEAHGVVIRAGNARFTAQNATFKLEIATKNGAGEVQTRQHTDWLKFASLFNLDVHKLGQEIVYGGKRFKVTGLLVKSRKYPVAATEVATGRSFKLPASAVPKPAPSASIQAI